MVQRYLSKQVALLQLLLLLEQKYIVLMQEIPDVLLHPEEEQKIYLMIINQIYPLKKGELNELEDSLKKVE